MKLQPENVWDYPRPAVCEPFHGSLKVIVQNIVVAETVRGYRTLETTHPPSYYFPNADVEMAILKQNNHSSVCEWKGKACYFDLIVEESLVANIGWSYRKPTSSFSEIKDCISFYASKVDTCFVNDEQVVAQEGDFYGGWITSNLKGPFKGGKGTFGW